MTLSSDTHESARHGGSRRGARRLSWPGWLLGGVGLTVGWASAIVVAMHVMTGMTLHEAALFAHLAALVVGFGAVLAADFQAAMWLFGRRTLPDVVRFGAQTHALIWVGVTGLVLSGILLHPDLSAPLTRVKMALVLVVLLNGLGALALQHRIRAVGVQRIPSRLLARAVVIGLVSQAAWWGAIGIGFASNAHAESAARAPATRSRTHRTGTRNRGRSRVHAPMPPAHRPTPKRMSHMPAMTG